MAIARLSIKVGKAGKAGPHSSYIAREGQYAKHLERGEKLEATEAGNMPAWAQVSAQAFWNAADAHERVNGTTYREMEIALPRELSAAQRLALVRDFVRQELGDRHAYQWAIHSPTAADGGEQPHVHLMFSERQCDGIQRDPKQYFKRYNAKVPEKGGARKGYGPHAGQTLTAVERRADLVALRGRWEVMANQHLEQGGFAERIDMRSHAERGTGWVPEAKQLPSQWRGEGRSNVLEWRAARVELRDAADAVRQVLPNVSAEIISIEVERARRQQLEHERVQELERLREQQAAEQRQAREQQCIEKMTLPQLRAEIVLRRPASVTYVVERDPEVIEVIQQYQHLVEQNRMASVREGSAQRDLAEWREAHPIRTKAHDAGLVCSVYLDERSQVIEQAREQCLVLGPKIEHAKDVVHRVRGEAHVRITQEQVPALERLSVLEQRASHLEQLAVEQRRAEEQQKTQEQRSLQAKVEARLLVLEVLEVLGMVAKLASGAAGWQPGGRKLNALSDPAVKDVRKLIEGLAAVASGDQRDILAKLIVERLAKDPASRLRLSEQVELIKHGLRHDRDQDHDHEMSF